jgi:hypothetical protein
MILCFFFFFTFYSSIVDILLVEIKWKQNIPHCQNNFNIHNRKTERKHRNKYTHHSSTHTYMNLHSTLRILRFLVTQWVSFTALLLLQGINVTLDIYYKTLMWRQLIIPLGIYTSPCQFCHIQYTIIL